MSIQDDLNNLAGELSSEFKKQTRPKKPMSDGAALRKARKLIGHTATVHRGMCHRFKTRNYCSQYKQGHPDDCAGAKDICSIGKIVNVGGIRFNYILGQGLTWDEAFAKLRY